MANTKRTEGQTTQWSIQKEQKDRQHNDLYKKNRRTDNTMENTKRTEGRTTQWPIQKEQKDKTLHRKLKIELPEPLIRTLNITITRITK
jgi:hypothetical protein